MSAVRGGIERSISNLLLFIAAAVLLFEEWFWDRSTAVAARLGRLPLLRDVEYWIRKRSRWQALALFVLPVVVIYPLKAVAILAMAQGYTSLGITAFVVAKLLATAVFARLYQLTSPAITQIRWVRHARDAFLRWRAFMHAWLNARPFYRRARALIRHRSARIKQRYRAAYRLHKQRRRSVHPSRTPEAGSSRAREPPRHKTPGRRRASRIS